MLRGRIEKSGLKRLALFGLAVVMVSSVLAQLAPTISAWAVSSSTATTAAGFTPDQEAASYSYYVALSGCMGNMKGDFNSTVAGNGDSPPSEWFDDYNAYGYIYPNGTKTDCKAIVPLALNAWGWTGSTQAFLSAMNYTYQANSSTGQPTYHGTSDGTTRLKEFQTLVKNQVYGAKAPSLSGAAQYDIALNAFTQNGGPCGAKDLGTYASLQGTTQQKYVDAGTIVDSSPAGRSKTLTTYVKLPIVDSTTGASVDHGYTYTYTLIATPGGTSADLVTLYGYHDPSTTTTSSCEDLVKSIKKNAVAYSTAIQASQTGDTKPADICKTNPSDPSCATTSAPTCGDVVQGIGWIVCPVFTFIGGLNDVMWGFMSALLTVSPVQQNLVDASGAVVSDAAGNPVASPTYQVWGAFRSIANVVLAIAFLFMIFSQLTSMGISNYGVKKLLPRWVVAAILINLSFPLMQVVVDVANITGSSLYSLIGNLAQFDPATVSWAKLETLVAAGGLSVGVGAAALVLAPGAVFAMILPLIVAGAVGFLAALVVLMLRQALIPILIAVSPVAIAFYLIPNTKPWFDKWKNLLVSMLMLFPIAGLVFGGAKLAAAVIAGGKDWWATLLSLVVLSVPLFTLPFLARQAGPMLGKIGGAVNGLRNGARGLARSAVDPMKQRSIAQARNRIPVWGAVSRRRTRTKLEAQAFEAQHTAEFNRGLAGHPEWAGRVQGQDAQAFMRGAASRAEAEELKSARTPLKQEVAAVRSRGEDVDAFLEHSATDLTRSASEREAAMHEAAELGRDRVVRTLTNHAGVDQQAMQRAIAAGAGSLIGKAPDTVKGADAAFGTTTGDQMAGYSSGTAAVHLDHLDRLHDERVRLGAAAAAPDASPDDVQAALAAQTRYEQAVGSFNSAIDDIQNTPALQSKFGGDVGKQYTTGAAALPAAVRADLTGLARIQAADGKIR
jgi:hypothetical protein